MPTETLPITTGRPRPLQALAIKAIAYQKRQMFANVCCICLCPIILVSIAGGLGALFLFLVAANASPKDILVCSNVKAFDDFGIPIWSSDDPRIPITPADGFPGASLPKVHHVNYAYVPSFSNSGPPGAAKYTFTHPCVFWYGTGYPQSNSNIYQPIVNVSNSNLVRDASYTAQPPAGWFNSLLTQITSNSINPDTLTIFQNQQTQAWSYYAIDPAVDPTAVGTRSKSNPMPIIQLLASPQTPDFVSPQSASTGLLGTIPTRYYFNFTSLNLDSPNTTALPTVQPVPWFTPSGGREDDLDDAIGAAINGIIESIASLDKSALLKGSRMGESSPNINKLFIEISRILNDLPHGAIYFKKINHQETDYALTFHFGSDIRLASSSNFPGPGTRSLLQLTQLDNAILRNSNPAELGQWTITQGFRVLPFIYNTKIDIPIGSIVGIFLYPLGVTFLLPIFVVMLVQEKELRVLVMMKMNGMKEYAYYASNYITFFVLFSVSTLLFVVSGYLWKLTLFTLTDFSVLFVILFLWGNVQIALAFFFSTLFNKSRVALIVTFTIVLLSTIISQALTYLFDQKQIPSAFFIYPPFAFYRALILLNQATFDSMLVPYKMRNLVPGDEVFTTIVFMIVEIPVFLLIASYLNAVFPSEFGVCHPWHFPVTYPIKHVKKMRRNAAGVSDSTLEADLAMSIKVDESETKFEDEDVKAERARIDQNNFDPKSPLIVKHMRKVYAGRGGAGPKLAVKDVTFAVEKGIVFGLLGPNGAGKTTLISILTGLYEASTGQGTLGGFDIKRDTEEVYKRLGICPQFDILWDDLTVGEHLYFYARLKGVSKENLRAAVDTALANVSLTNFENRLTKGLSGGEKRRLSISIALLGNPAVVFLDEPTTGLDPEVRRLIWNIVNNSREGRTIVLTTHSMEEAEALCQRIGIMAKGTLRCIANPTRLKQLYGSGFKLFLNALEEDMPRACEFVESLMPSGWVKVDAFSTNTSYEFPPVPGILSRLFAEIEEAKSRVGILDWGIGQTTLEEVFIRLISENDADAEY